jgi:hypothetical protein
MQAKLFQKERRRGLILSKYLLPSMFDLRISFLFGHEFSRMFFVLLRKEKKVLNGKELT